jgi:hypothetical protein
MAAATVLLPLLLLLCQGLLDDLKEACKGCSTALTAAVAFLDSRQLGMVALLDRQAKELLKQVQVRMGSVSHGYGSRAMKV